MNAIPGIFDRKRITQNRNRAAEAFENYDFLYREVAERLLDRLLDINRHFEKILVIGAQAGLITEILRGYPSYAKAEIITLDLSAKMAPDVVADEEALPLGRHSVDCVISNLNLHFANDLPGCLAQIGYALKPDGLFMASILGPQSLSEFRTALMQAELELFEGAGNRIAPFVDIVDATALMQRAQFALPVVDQDSITVSYPDVFKLMRDLRGMGVASPLVERSQARVSRGLFEHADAIYKAGHGEEEGRIPVVFEILYLTGWTPHESQQQPLRPGSAQTRLADALEAEEKPVDDPAMPK
ncbi:MAG: methyltransferase domain-containing protein [Pseudomonadota bacterium]